MEGISFVVPVYNAADYLAETVDSICQTNWTEGDQLVLVNDGSTDRSAAVITNLCARYKGWPITVLTQPNKGCGESRNVGNEFASNPLIFAVDADNVLAPGTAAKLKAALGDADAVATSAIWFFRGKLGNRSGLWRFPDEIPLSLFLARNDLPTSSMNFLYRRAFWERVPHAAGVGALEAWTWGLRALMAGMRLRTAPLTYYWHRQGIESLWIRDNRTVDFDQLATKQIEPYLDRLEPDSAKRAADPLSQWYTSLNKSPLRLKAS